MLSTAPCAPETGDTVLIVGAGGGAAVTVNPFVNIPLCASVFVTVTVRAPGEAAAPTVILEVIEVAEFKLQVLTVTPVPKEQVGPVKKPVPVIAILVVAPCCALVGVIEVTVGTGFTKGVTVKEDTAVPVCPSGFMIAILRSPRVVLAASVMFAVICVTELKIQLLMVILAPKLQVAPL